MAYISAGLKVRDTVSDDSSLALQGPLGVHAMTVGAQTFVFVASTQDDGVQGFNLHADGELAPASTTYDAAGLGLNGATNFASIGNYLYVSANDDSAITAFEVSAAGALTSGTTVASIGGPGGRMSTFEAGGLSYLAVAGYDSGELKLFRANGTTLSPVQVISDQQNAAYRLSGAVETATATVGGNTFVLVCSFEESAVSVFSLNSSILSYVSNVEDTDSPSVELGGALGMATGTVNGTTFVVVAAKSDNGLSVFSLSGAGLLTNVFNLEDSPSIPMAQPNGITSFVIDGETFVAVTATGEAGMTVFHLGAGGVLSYLTSFTDTAQTAVAGASSPAFANVGGSNLLITAGMYDGGATSFDLGGGNDTLVGTSAADQMFGFAGNDTLNGQAGADIMRGGTGNDIFYVDNVADMVVEGAGAVNGIDTIRSSVSYTLSARVAVESLATTASSGTTALNLAGNEFAQAVIGNDGSNVLSGFAGDDTLSGLAGNDTIDGGVGADTMSGGTGNDNFYVDNSGDKVIEVAGTAGGNDAIFFSASLGLGADAAVESLASSRKAGTVAINITGNDFAQNIGGNDGVNILNGQGGDDVIAGNGGNDRLFGSLGNDTLLGGTGNDLFFFDTKANATTNHDVISDFSNVAGNNDTVYLNHAIYTTLAAGSLGGAFAANAAGVATQADDRIIYETDTGNLFYDVNGIVSGGSTLFATLTGHQAITVSDFVVY